MNTFKAYPQAPLLSSFAVLLSMTTAACTAEQRILPPREPPPITLRRDTPRSPENPTTARVSFETTDGPRTLILRAEQYLVIGTSQLSFRRRVEMCVTPCTVDIPAGPYEIVLKPNHDDSSDWDTDRATFKPGVSHYVRAPGKETPSKPALVGGALMATGVTSSVAGAMSAMFTGWYTEPTDKIRDRQAAGAAFLLTGVLVTAVGAVVYDYERGAGRGVKQAGATTIWQPERATTSPLRESWRRIGREDPLLSLTISWSSSRMGSISVDATG